MNYDDLMANLRGEMEQLGFRADPSTQEVAEGLLLLDQITGWLRPQIPVLLDVAQVMNAGYLLSHEAAGIHLDPDQLSHHTLAVTMVLLAKMARSGALVIPPGP